MLEATVTGLGEDCNKAKLTASSGEGNRFCWTDGAWVFGNEVTESINETPFETENRVLSAIGWNAKYITVQRSLDGSLMNTDTAQIRQDFISAIDKGFPVLIRYIEHADCDLNVFFGYEDNGEKIIGYNYNNGFEPGVSQPSDVSIPVSWDHWEDNIVGYILLQWKTNTSKTASGRTASGRTAGLNIRKEFHRLSLQPWPSHQLLFLELSGVPCSSWVMVLKDDAGEL